MLTIDNSLLIRSKRKAAVGGNNSDGCPCLPFSWSEIEWQESSKIWGKCWKNMQMSQPKRYHGLKNMMGSHPTPWDYPNMYYLESTLGDTNK